MTGKIRRSFECPGRLRDRRNAIQVSPDGNLVAFDCYHASDNCAILNITTGETRFWSPRLVHSQNAPLHFAFSPDSKLIAVASVLGIEIFHIATWKMLQCLQTPEGVTISISFSPSGKVLASGCEFGTITLWDVTTFEESRKSQNPIPYPQDRSTLFNVNGTAVMSDDGDIFFWDPESQRCRTMKGQENRHRNSGLALSPGGKLVASCQPPGKTYLWDTATGARRHVLKGGPEDSWDQSALQFSPNGKLLAAATLPKMITICLGYNHWEKTA
ncbi:unnamed protein product [Penicillium salamii]|nr:unnamed protein product [Penicillium salamii]CAG8316781.1 unnamed protein product [Penicillium salamii]